MTAGDWRARAGTVFETEKRPATGARGMVVTDVPGPPPSGGGIHRVQMLNLLEGFGELGYGTADGIHLLAEVLKIAFADREAATGDPAFVDVPVERLVAKDYASARRAEIDMKGGAARIRRRRRVRSHDARHRGRRRRQRGRDDADPRDAVGR